MTQTLRWNRNDTIIASQYLSMKDPLKSVRYINCRRITRSQIRGEGVDSHATHNRR